MKHFIIVVGIAVALVLIKAVGMLLYKHFITDQIKDKGGMENPNYIANTDNASVSFDGGETKARIDAAFGNEECHELIGLSYYWCSGSMAGENYSYSIKKDSTGNYRFYAELESGNCIVDKKILQEEFNAIMQNANDNYAPNVNIAPAEAANEYVVLDADSFGFEVIFSDEQTQSADFGQAGGDILSQLKKLMNE